MAEGIVEGMMEGFMEKVIERITENIAEGMVKDIAKKANIENKQEKLKHNIQQILQMHHLGNKAEEISHILGLDLMFVEKIIEAGKKQVAIGEFSAECHIILYLHSLNYQAEEISDILGFDLKFVTTVIETE